MSFYNNDCVAVDYTAASTGTLDITQIFPTTSAPKRKAIPAEVRNYIYQKYNYTCQICNRYMPCGFYIENNKCVKITIDHIVPIKEGGSNNTDNLQVLCEVCNKMKGTKPMSIFKMKEENI